MPFSAFPVDFHNHLMPGADDGAQDAEAARGGLEVLAADGVDTIIASVHLDASLMSEPAAWRERLERIDEAFDELREVASAHSPEMDLRRGAEVKLDAPDVDFRDPRLRLAETRFVLVEFPRLEVPPFGPALLRQVAAAGYQPILAHPERYRGARDLTVAATEWIEAGARLQLNHGSMLGRYGRTAQSAAAALLAEGMVSYVSSDYHARGGTWARETIAALRAADGGAEAIDALAENGRRILRDEPPAAVPPIRRPGGLIESLRSFIRR